MPRNVLSARLAVIVVLLVMSSVTLGGASPAGVPASGYGLVTTYQPIPGVPIAGEAKVAREADGLPSARFVQDPASAIAATDAIEAHMCQEPPSVVMSAETGAFETRLLGPTGSEKAGTRGHPDGQLKQVPHRVSSLPFVDPGQDVNEPEGTDGCLNPAPLGQPLGWVKVMSEGFEGIFPSGSWTVTGDPCWDDHSAYVRRGSWAAYCVDGGAHRVSWPGPYPANTRTIMKWGPFSLSGCDDAEMTLDRMVACEVGYDTLKYGYSTNNGSTWNWTYADGHRPWTRVVKDLSGACGQSQVWIGMLFTSDGSVNDTGACIDSILVMKHTPDNQPDLTYYTLSGWDYPIVPSNNTGTHTVPATLYAGTNYIDWCGKNIGTGSTVDSFWTYLYRDGTPLSGWRVPPVPADWYFYFEDFSTTITAGSHTLMTMQDSMREISESNENNNRYSRTWTWVNPPRPDLTYYTPSGWDYPIVPSNVTGTHTVPATLRSGTNYIDWACRNSGTGATTWGAPGSMDTCSDGCSMKPEVTFGDREEAAEVLHARV